MGTDGVRKEYKPTSKQRKAHEAKETYILFGGAVGGSKSTFICNEVIQHCLKYPGARVYLARHELTSFKKTTYLTLMEFLPMNFITKHNRSECFIEFFNGSRIFYGGLGDDVRAIERLKSMEISAYAVDQAEETTEAFFHMLNSRLRLKIPGVKYKGWLTCNPTGGWLRSRFIDKQIEDHRFIPAKITDNPYLPSNYEENLRKTLPEELVKAWIEGNWDVIASENTVFKFDQVMAAMERNIEVEGDFCLGVDVARYGKDETVIAKKTGNKITFEEIFSKKDLMETAGRVIQILAGNKGAPVKIDSIGVGGGVADRLKEQNFNMVEVVSSHSAIQNNIYKNKRAENYFRLRDLLPELDIPNDEKLRGQMLSIRYRTFSDGLLIIESKDELSRRGLSSPDRLDAIVIACSEEQITEEGTVYTSVSPPVSIEDEAEIDEALRERVINMIDRRGFASVAILMHATGYSEGPLGEMLVKMNFVEHRPGHFIFGKGFKRELPKKKDEEIEDVDVGTVGYLSGLGELNAGKIKTRTNIEIVRDHAALLVRRWNEVDIRKLEAITKLGIPVIEDCLRKLNYRKTFMEGIWKKRRKGILK